MLANKENAMKKLKKIKRINAEAMLPETTETALEILPEKEPGADFAAKIEEWLEKAKQKIKNILFISWKINILILVKG